MELGVPEFLPVAGPADAADWSGADCVGLYFSRRGESDLGEFWFEVDEISFYGTGAWPSRAGSAR